MNYFFKFFFKKKYVYKNKNIRKILLLFIATYTDENLPLDSSLKVIEIWVIFIKPY